MKEKVVVGMSGGVDSSVYHMAFELLPEIHHVMGNLQGLGHSPGILHRRQAAAPLAVTGFLPPIT